MTWAKYSNGGRTMQDKSIEKIKLIIRAESVQEASLSIDQSGNPTQRKIACNQITDG